jgi:tRNA pseudouridine55 synthase
MPAAERAGHTATPIHSPTSADDESTVQQKRKTPRRAIDGVLLLDKDDTLTSNAALQRAKRLYNAAKAGHTGTLDPLASGLLPVCFGEATKFSSDLLDADKTYDAVIMLGVVTDTQDAEGQVLARSEVRTGRAEAEAALARLRGAIEQVPPMHSALKHQGRPLYAYARAGIEIERAPRRVTIYRLDLTEFEGARLRVLVECSKGTYIRTLAQDLGEILGCGAHLAGLRRTRVGSLDIAHALTLEALEGLSQAARDDLLGPVDSLVATLPAAQLDAEGARRFGQGQAVSLQPAAQAGGVRVYAGSRFLGVGTVDAGGTLAPRRLLATPAA